MYLMLRINHAGTICLPVVKGYIAQGPCESVGEDITCKGHVHQLLRIYFEQRPCILYVRVPMLRIFRAWTICLAVVKDISFRGLGYQLLRIYLKGP